MKKALRLVLLLALFVAVAGTLAVSSLVTAPEAEAAGCIRCHCTIATPTTPDTCVDGPTCAGAKSILLSTLEGIAGCQSFCLEDLTITMDCTPNGGGGYWVCGTLTYQCEICKDLCL